MNFLAHIYLSGDNEQVILGNFFADSVKGKRYLDYPMDVQKGILLHRAIDYFTDTHPIFRQSTSRLFDKYRHYNAVIVDIFYDHFLAVNWERYSRVPLESYAVRFYDLLHQNYKILPSGVKNFMPYMLRDNWLVSYQSVEGIKKTLYQMNQRTKNRSRMDLAVEELEAYYPQFQEEFTMFFEEAQVFAADKLSTL